MSGPVRLRLDLAVSDAPAGAQCGFDGPPAFECPIFVRYWEADQQGVVYNSHYLAYCDLALDLCLRRRKWRVSEEPFDFMVKRAEIEWHGSARYAEELTIALAATRWGTTSFAVGYRGTVGDRPVFAAGITYVGVHLGTVDTMATPDGFKALLAAPGAG